MEKIILYCPVCQEKKVTLEFPSPLQAYEIEALRQGHLCSNHANELAPATTYDEMPGKLHVHRGEHSGLEPGIYLPANYVAFNDLPASLVVEPKGLDLQNPESSAFRNFWRRIWNWFSWKVTLRQPPR